MVEIRSSEDATAVQSAALGEYTDDCVGYAVVGSNEAFRHMLGLRAPIYCPVPERDYYNDNCRIHLPEGVIGAQCELIFTIGAGFPDPGETITRVTVANEIIACHPAIGIIGHRTRRRAASMREAIADFGLHVATICGSVVDEHAGPSGVDNLVMTARVDDKIVVTADANAILGHPIEAVVWLAQKLAAEGKRLEAGDIVATGSCAPILQVLPGQYLTVTFDGLGTVACSFT